MAAPAVEASIGDGGFKARVSVDRSQLTLKSVDPAKVNNGDDAIVLEIQLVAVLAGSDGG